MCSLRFARDYLSKNSTDLQSSRVAPLVVSSPRTAFLCARSLGLLRLVRMLVALVDLELLRHGLAHLALGQHPLDCFLYHLLGLALHALVEFFRAQAAG